jgi:hypothetical protein
MTTMVRQLNADIKQNQAILSMQLLKITPFGLVMGILESQRLTQLELQLLMNCVSLVPL